MNHKFNKVLYEFIPDLIECFPEYQGNLDVGVTEIMEKYKTHNEQNEIEECEYTENMKAVYTHSKETIPVHFFNILYKNEEIFTKKDESQFILGIYFHDLWKEGDLSDNTREIIWKYLQLFLFSIVSDMEDSSMFGDTAKLFETINEDEFKTKLEETMDEMQDFFKNMEKEESSSSNSEGSQFKNGDFPDPNKIHEHIQSMMDGNIGKLAKEIAQETMDDLDMNTEENKEMTPDGIFKTLFRDPAKLMKITKNIGNKLEGKIKTGEIKETELMQEASEMMTKMKDMPGMDQFNDIIRAFGGGGNKMNTKATNNAMTQKMNQMSMRQRMQDILKSRQEANDRQPTNANEKVSSNKVQGEGKHQKFSVDDPSLAPEKSKRQVRINNKKKNKKKK